MTMTIVLYFLGRNLDFSNAGPDFRQVRKDNRRQCRQLIETSNQGQDHASGGHFRKKRFKVNRKMRRRVLLQLTSNLFLFRHAAGTVEFMLCMS